MALDYTSVMGAHSFEETDHTADRALTVRGKDLDDLLRNAAMGMLDLAGAVASPGPGLPREIRLRAVDEASLLVSWLEELLYSLETLGRTWTDIAVRTQAGQKLEAVVRQVPLAGLSESIKAVTYHALSIRRTADGLETTIVFDV
jgi:SHS2 domain-containing protein